MNSKQSPVDDKAAMKQSIKDDMEIWKIVFRQHLEEVNVNKININKLLNNC